MGRRSVPWPVWIVCRWLPLAVVVTSGACVALSWSHLHGHRAAVFVVPGFLVLGGAVVLLPEAVAPSVPERGSFDEAFTRPLLSSSLVLAWVWSRFGRAATGLLLVCSGSGLASATAIGGLGAHEVKVSLVGVLASLGAAIVVAVGSGHVLRIEARRLRPVPRDDL